MARKREAWFSSGLYLNAPATYTKEQCRITAVRGLPHDQNGYSGGLEIELDKKTGGNTVLLTRSDRSELLKRARVGEDYGRLCNKNVVLYCMPVQLSTLKIERGKSEGNRQHDMPVGISYPAL